MTEPLLVTKFDIPPLREHFVLRPRLIEKLNRALTSRLTLVTAPAGFGKTTLLCSWLETTNCDVAWLSLDKQDDNPVRFLLYLLNAFRAIDSVIGKQSLALLNADYNVAFTTTLLPPLVNDVTHFTEPLVFVLDDYHVIEHSAIHEVLDFLISHAPPNLHIVIASRNQPLLNIPLLRGRAQLLEVESSDLRFTATEVEAFLRDVMGLELSSADRIALEMRTEGWIAGVQLAGLSLRDHANPSAFIGSLTGTDRYIGDYLFEEILKHQPEDIQRFLLFTSVVDSLCSDLCDALLEAKETQVILERLDRLQLFLVPMDHQRLWYRYHHLFGDLLRHRLQQVYPDQLPALHQRASIWYERLGRLEDAIHHTLAAEDFEHTADLMEAVFERRDWVRHDMHHLLDWFEMLPESVAQSRPRLILSYSWLLLELYTDRWDRIEQLLVSLENQLADPESLDPYPQAERQEMLAQVDLLYANHARSVDDSARVIEYCQRALDRLPESELYIRSGTLVHLASAYERLGDVRQARELYTDGYHQCQSAKNVDGLLFASSRLIEVLKLSGQLHQAEAVFEQVRVYEDTRTGPDMGAVYIAIGDVYREWNQLDIAESCLRRGIDLCLPFEAWHGAGLSGIQCLMHTFVAKGHTSVEIERFLTEAGGEFSHAAPLESASLESVKIRLWLAEGDYKSAALFAKYVDVSFTDDVAFDREYDQITLARVLIAQATLQTQGIHDLNIATHPLIAAQGFLHRLYEFALSGGRVGRVIEIRVLQARLYALKDNMDEALRYLEDALSMAEPESYMRMFVDEGLPMFRLLTLHVTRPIASAFVEYARTLLAAFPKLDVDSSALTADHAGKSLTESELRTLKLLASERTVEEIASELSVAVSTVRTYTKRIYSKLDAHSRTEAVYRAKALNLL